MSALDKARPAETRMAPKVSAILTVADPARAGTIARTAVNQFLRQTYQNKEVVIVNTSGNPVLTGVHEWINEIKAEPGAFDTIAAARNEGIKQATGDWILALDDDDHNHKHRVAFQMAHRREGHAVLLSNQVRLDISPPVRNNERGIVVALLRAAAGIPSTMLFPRCHPDGTLVQYDAAMPLGEDDALAATFDKVVLDNNADWFPGPALQLAIWHGRNAKDRDQFLGAFAARGYEGACDPAIPKDVLDYIVDALGGYGLQVSFQPADAPAQE